MDDLPNFDLADGDFAKSSIREAESCLLRGIGDERPDLSMGAIHREVFQRTREGEEEEEKSPLDVGTDRGGADCHREHEEVDVENAATNLVECVD